MKDFEYRYDVRTVFDDFLTLSICACSQNSQTGISYYEDLFLQTMIRYLDDPFMHNFPKMFAQMICEMECRVRSDTGNDVLGEFYEQHLYRKGASQYFTPWPMCTLLAKSTIDIVDIHATREPIRILDPSCGSGRMLLATALENGPDHSYYGIDIDETCVKMTALNMFLNGIFHSEVMCGDALSPDDFRVSYKISFLPFGIFRVDEKEQSYLWTLHKNSFRKVEVASKCPSMVFQGKTLLKGSQLKLF